MKRFQILFIWHESRSLFRFYLYFVLIIAISISKIDLCSCFPLITYNWFVLIITVKKLGMFFNHEKRKEKRKRDTAYKKGGDLLPLTSSSSIVVLLSVDSFTWEPSPFFVMMLRPGVRRAFINRHWESENEEKMSREIEQNKSSIEDYQR